MRTFACVVFVLYLGLAGTAVAHGGGGGGTGTGLSSLTFAIFPPQQDHYRHPHPHHARHLERKIVIHHVAKAKHHHFHPSGYAEDLTPRDNVSSETSITQMPINKTYTLSLGTPLLGLDPRSPGTWELYSEMLPFIFSEAPDASD